MWVRVDGEDGVGVRLDGGSLFVQCKYVRQD